MRQTSFAVLVVCCLTSAFMARTQSGSYGISVIVVSKSDDAAELRRQLETGASFEVLAIKHSTDPTAEHGGFIGTRDRLALGPTVRSVLDELAPGGVSAPIGTGSAFILLKRATPEEDRWRAAWDAGVDALRRERYPDAVPLLEKAVGLAEILGNEDVRLAETLNALAEAYRHQEDAEHAEPTSRRSLAILEAAFGGSHRAILPSLESLAAILQARGDSAEAERVYRRILAVRWNDPSTPAATGALDVLDQFAEVLSLAYTRDPQLTGAVERFGSLVGQSRLNADLYVALSDGLMSVALVSEAEAVMLTGVKAYPDSMPLRLQLAEFYVESEKYQKALETFQEAVKRSLHSDPDVARLQLGHIYQRIASMYTYLVRFDDALEAVHRAEEVDPENPRPRLLAGDLLLRRNQFAAAGAEYTQAVVKEPGIAAAHHGLAQVYLTQGRFAESVKEAEAALTLDPSQQRSRYVLGIALIRSGQRQEGKKVLEDYERVEEKRRTEKASRLDIDDVERSVSSELTALRPAPAMELLAGAIDAHPLTPVLYLRLALLQGRLGLHREAAETLETMIRLKLDDFLAHRAVAGEYELLGNAAASRGHRVTFLQKLDAALQASVR